MIEAMLVSEAQKSGGGGIPTTPEEYLDFINQAIWLIPNGGNIDSAGNSPGDAYTVGYTNYAKPTAAALNYGSPWGDVAQWAFHDYRLLQQCAYDLDTFRDIVANIPRVLYYIGPRQPRNSWNSVTHNEFKSTAFNGYSMGFAILDFIYWDSRTGKMMRNNPSQRTPPLEFDGVLIKPFR